MLPETDRTTTVQDCGALDLRGVVCPAVLARIAEALADQPEPDLEVLSDHATSVNVTVPAYCASHGLELRTVWVEGPVHRLGIRRAVPDPAS